MAIELCEDVRRLIMDKVRDAEDMLMVFACTFKKGEYSVMCYVHRNMRDPEGHVSFTQITVDLSDGSEHPRKIATTELVRTEKALQGLLYTELGILFYDCDVWAFYKLGCKAPPSHVLHVHGENMVCEERDFVNGAIKSRFNTYVEYDDSDEIRISNEITRIMKMLQLVTHG